MQLDPELSAMNEALEIFKYLRQDERKRITDWIKARFNLIDQPPAKETPVPTPPATTGTPPSPEAPEVTEVTGAPEAHEAVETPEPSTPEEFQEDVPETIPVIKKRKSGRPPKTDASGINFGEFDNIEELFLTSDVKKVSHRILLAAAYLQEKSNLDEVSSLDINTQLKKLGYGVTNITTLINGLLKKKPPLMEVTKKEGTTKQARRKFKVSPQGFIIAKKFVKET